MAEQKKVDPRLLGSGMAGKAGAAIQNDPAYQMHVVDAMTNGTTPLSYDQWKLAQAKQAQVQLQDKVGKYY